MENKGLKFEKAATKTYCNIVLEADYCDVHNTIDTLLECLSGMDESLVGNSERFYITQLIRALLPSEEQMLLLSEAQLKASKKL